ncbi:hypothetical protein OV207_05990 [Corallococcus sp. BB11-1]|uniref:hypothetical protein n=1 Tax=Corallococcus sp. BB11-1 TaxID=2996783 RepID=UPI0010D4627F|nr:hypothetical protein [Corallococcus sp. BB11-1]MCY1030998.1 hypothetical protein [Corallococcus sp. BB11-1]RYZ46983.1 MAG: hypothetical protein EOO72_00650 [Myxococcaceae bacterium]
MMPFKKQGMTLVLGAVLGVGATGVATGFFPEQAQARLGPTATQGQIHDDHGEYALGPEGYVAQSDVIVTGRITRVLDAQTHPRGSKSPRYSHQLELVVDEELYRNTERAPGERSTRRIVSVPAAGTDLSMGRAHIAAPGGGTHLFFLRRSPLVPGAFVLLRGENGRIDLTGSSVQHEVLRGGTPSAILDEVRRYAATVRVSPSSAVRESLGALPEGVQPGRFYGRSDTPAGLRQALKTQQDGVLVFDALPEGAVASRLHVLNVGDKCFVRTQWEPGAASGPVALHVKDGALSPTCEALLDKTF